MLFARCALGLLLLFVPDSIVDAVPGKQVVGVKPASRWLRHKTRRCRRHSTSSSPILHLKKKHLTGLESLHCPPWTRWAQSRAPMKSSLGRQWGFGLGEGGAAWLCEDMSREAEGGREEIGPRKAWSAWSLLNCRIYPAWHGIWEHGIDLSPIARIQNVIFNWSIKETRIRKTGLQQFWLHVHNLHWLYQLHQVDISCNRGI